MKTKKKVVAKKTGKKPAKMAKIEKTMHYEDGGLVKNPARSNRRHTMANSTDKMQGRTTGTRTDAGARAKQARIAGSDAAAGNMRNRAQAQIHQTVKHNVGRPAAPYPERERATKASMRSKNIAAKSASITAGRAPADLGPRGSAGTVRRTSVPAPASFPKSSAIQASTANTPRTSASGKSNYIGKGDITRKAAKAATDRTKRNMRANLKAPTATAATVTNASSLGSKVKAVARKVARVTGSALTSIEGPAVSIAESAQRQMKRESDRDFRKATGIKDA